MAVIRAFIAVELASEITSQLEQVSAGLKQQLQGVAVRWVPVRNIHLTLKFLGDVSTSNLDMLKKILQTEAGGHRPFTIEVSGLGAFPSLQRPRVIWVGVEAPPELSTIQRGIENEMARLGYAREDRPFSPHLTLGRVGRSATPQDVRLISQVLKSSNVGRLGTSPVAAVHLFSSDLRPEGAVYTCLFTARMGSG